MLPGINGYEKCNGCGLCTLPCPIWRQSYDSLLTFAGRARALQGGAKIEEIRNSVDACILCGSCEAACSMGIRTVDITLKLRAAINKNNEEMPIQRYNDQALTETTILLPNAALLADKKTLKLTTGLLNIPLAKDNSQDILLFLLKKFEVGFIPEAEMLEGFLRRLIRLRQVVIADGLFKRYIRALIPELHTEILGLGEALLRLPAIKNALKPTDLYIIEARSYNMDFKRCMPFYTEISSQTGCRMNLDLQRIAIPTGGCINTETGNEFTPKSTGQIRWILEGRSFDRIVVESVEDIGLLKNAVVGVPVVHVAELAGENAL